MAFLPQDPQAMQQLLAMLSGLGAGLSQAGAPSPYPVKFGQALAMGNQGMTQALRQSQEDQLRRQYAQQQAQDLKLKQDARDRGLDAAFTMISNPPKDWSGTQEQWTARVITDAPGAAKLYDPKDPVFKTIREGQTDITALFDPKTGEMLKEISHGAAFAPQQPREPTQHDQEIASLRARGMSQEDAEDIANGNVKVSVDSLGDVHLTNVVTGKSRTIAADEGTGESGDTATNSGTPGASQATAVPVTTRAQMQALPSGTWVRLPDGSVVQRK
jgi:hypothetical protein